MATLYVDPAAVGANNGTSWANAWTSLQSALDNAVAGDEVFCRGSHLSAAFPPGGFTVDTNSGDLVNGLIKFIGCNAAGNVDGTRFVLDGEGVITPCLGTWTQSRLWFENFTFRRADFTAVDLDGIGAVAEQIIFINCVAELNGAFGWKTSNGNDDILWIRCQSNNNGQSGWGFPPNAGRWFCCVGYGNSHSMIGSGGWTDDHVMINCIGHDNGDGHGQIWFDENCVIYNCVLDGTDQANETGLASTGAGWNLIIGNRLTNMLNGIDAGGDLLFSGWNYFHNNTNNIANAGFHYALPDNGTADTNQADVDGDAGYNNVGNDDFNLRSGRTYSGDGNDTLDLQIGS